jgi:hypothetical protein
MKELRLRLHFIVFLLAPDSQPEVSAIERISAEFRAKAIAQLD